MKYVLPLILCLFLLAGCGGGGGISSNWPQGTYVGTVHDSGFGDVSCELTITGRTVTGHFGGGEDDPYYSIITQCNPLNFEDISDFGSDVVTFAGDVKLICEGKDTAGLPDYMKNYDLDLGRMEFFEDGHISLSMLRNFEIEDAHGLAVVSGDLFPQ
ncbi:MAG: hypothetical protein ACYC27_21735 [Armatimonadota bacterium]